MNAIDVCKIERDIKQTMKIYREIVKMLLTRILHDTHTHTHTYVSRYKNETNLNFNPYKRDIAFCVLILSSDRRFTASSACASCSNVSDLFSRISPCALNYL